MPQTCNVSDDSAAARRNCLSRNFNDNRQQRPQFGNLTCTYPPRDDSEGSSLVISSTAARRWQIAQTRPTGCGPLIATDPEFATVERFLFCVSPALARFAWDPRADDACFHDCFFGGALDRSRNSHLRSLRDLPFLAFARRSPSPPLHDVCVTVSSRAGLQFRKSSDARSTRCRTPRASVMTRHAFPQVLTRRYYNGTSLTCYGRILVSRAGEITIRGGPTHGQYAPAA
jgi:hypothetical protein